MPKRPVDIFVERLKAIPYGQNGRIAAEAGIDQGTLARWKRKDLRKNPTFKNIEGLARAFQQPIAWLFSDEEPETLARANPGSPHQTTAPAEADEYIKIRLRCPQCDQVIEKTKIERPATGVRQRRRRP